MNISVKARAEELGFNIDYLSKAMTESFEVVIGQLAAEARDEWIRRAQNRKVSQEYVLGLQKSESFTRKKHYGGSVYTISLVGKVPNMLEFGFPRYDMKTVHPGWLWGSKAKTSKKTGKQYVVIPFRHGASRSNIKYSGQAKKAHLQVGLEDTRKRYGLDKMVRTATGRVVEGAVRRAPKTPDVHPYLRGLTRVQKGMAGTTKAGQRGSSQLMTFRVMSEDSDPTSWIHPGFEGVKLLNEIERFVQENLDSKIRLLLSKGF